MKKISIILLVCLLSISANIQRSGPDLSKKEDIKALGIGKIYEKDKTITTKIVLEEIGDYYIVYIKNESLHDMTMDRISKIEFEETKWGPVKIEFPANKPKISLLQ